MDVASTVGGRPRSKTTIKWTYSYGDASNVDAACAAAAFADYRATTSEQRTQFLESIAANIERAVAESGLPQPRIAGEVGRTTGQLRLFAGVLREGGFSGREVMAEFKRATGLPTATRDCGHSAPTGC